MVATLAKTVMLVSRSTLTTQQGQSGRFDCRPERWLAPVRLFDCLFVGLQLKALRGLFLVPLGWLVAPFAGIGVIACVVALALFRARFIGAAEFGAPVAHGGGRIGLTQRRR